MNSFKYIVFLLCNILVFDSCTNREVSFEDNFILRVSVKRASTKHQTTNDNNIYVNNGNKVWAGKVLYVSLIESTFYDSTRPTPTPCNQNNPFSFQSQNEFCFKHSGVPTRRDPLYRDGFTTATTDNIFVKKPNHQSYTFLGTGEASQTIGLVDFFGVKEGVYDLIAFADIETTVEVDNNICTCTRAAGCSPEDFDDYLQKKAGGQCSVLQDISGQPMPSNGDVFYAIDNIVVNSETESRLSSLSLSVNGDKGLDNVGAGAGDGDVWDEWRCIYHMSIFTGLTLHDYTFPLCTVNSQPGYGLPNGNCGTNFTKTHCGTLMDRAGSNIATGDSWPDLDYNPF